MYCIRCNRRVGTENNQCTGLDDRGCRARESRRWRIVVEALLMLTNNFASPIRTEANDLIASSKYMYGE